MSTIWVADKTQCHNCRLTKRCLMVDSSYDFYAPAAICQDCIQQVLCPHERLEVRDMEPPTDLPEERLWITDPSLICLDCGVNLMNCPGDVSRIVNIPHYSEEECPHTHDIHTLAIGGYLCLNCGRRAIKCPETLLEVRQATAEEIDSSRQIAGIE